MTEGPFMLMPSSVSNDQLHLSSADVLATYLYSASVDDRATPLYASSTTMKQDDGQDK